MRIILSPAKKMNVDTDSLPWRDMPRLIAQTEQIYAALQAMSPETLQKLWKCSDSIAAENMDRLARYDLHSCLTPAILAYEGIAYQHMAPNVFTGEEFEYVQEHLRILSGLYGMLRPFDGVIPYRLEMQAPLSVAGSKDLYAFWGDRLCRELYSETDCVVNLASKEYSKCIQKHRRRGERMVTCVFAVEQGGKLKEKATLCKMARGEMVRYMAANRITTPEGMQGFTGLGFAFDPTRSDEETYVFVQSPAAQGTE